MKLPHTDEEIEKAATAIAAGIGGMAAFILSGAVASQLPSSWRIRRGAWAALGIAVTMFGASRMDAVKRRRAAEQDQANPDG